MKEVLWLNKETLEEYYLAEDEWLESVSWVKVPEGATFATGDKYDFTFRKDGWYYNKQEGGWVKTIVTLANIHTYSCVKLFWVKNMKMNHQELEKVLNFKKEWSYEMDNLSVFLGSEVSKQSKDKFTPERLLGCEVVYEGDVYFVESYWILLEVKYLKLCNEENAIYVSNLHTLTFFTEDGDELTFDEYVNMYYGIVV